MPYRYNLAVTVLLFLLGGCGFVDPVNVETDVMIGPTHLLVREGAQCEGAELLLAALQNTLTSYTDAATSEKVFATSVTFVPCESLLLWYGRTLPPETVGIYDPVSGGITIRTCQALMQGPLMHELFQHRYPHVLFSNANDSHESDWVKFEDVMRRELQVSLTLDGQ